MVVCFDFDGTICDSLPIAIPLIREYLRKNHLPEITIDQGRNLGLSGLLKHYHIPIFQIPGLMNQYRKILAEALSHADVFPNLPEVLTTLSQKHQLGIVSNTGANVISEFLEFHHLTPLFTFVEGNFNLFGKHQQIKKHHSDFYIGDSSRDITAGKKAGAKTIAVTWGYESKTLLQTFNPDFVAEKPTDLLKLLSPGK